jgi:hypothetical protein
MPVEGAMKVLRAWFSYFQCIFHLTRVNHCNCAQNNYWGITICILYVAKYFEEISNFVEGVCANMWLKQCTQFWALVVTTSQFFLYSQVKIFIWTECYHNIRFMQQYPFMKDHIWLIFLTFLWYSHSIHLREDNGLSGIWNTKNSLQILNDIIPTPKQKISKDLALWSFCDSWRWPNLFK